MFWKRRPCFFHTESLEINLQGLSEVQQSSSIRSLAQYDAVSFTVTRYCNITSLCVRSDDIFSDYPSIPPFCQRNVLMDYEELLFLIL